VLDSEPLSSSSPIVRTRFFEDLFISSLCTIFESAGSWWSLTWRRRKPSGTFSAVAGYRGRRASAVTTGNFMHPT
jgi:hypothetical protein